LSRRALVQVGHVEALQRGRCRLADAAIIQRQLVADFQGALLPARLYGEPGCIEAVIQRVVQRPA